MRETRVMMFLGELYFNSFYDLWQFRRKLNICNWKFIIDLQADSVQCGSPTTN